MKFKNEEVMQIIQMDLEETYRAFLIMSLENDQLEELKPLIRWGIHLKFDIWNVIEGKVQEKLKWNKIIIAKSKMFDLDRYRTELEEREALMKKSMIDNITEEEIIRPRFS